MTNEENVKKEYKTVKSISAPASRMELDRPYHVRVTGPIYTRAEMIDPKTGKPYPSKFEKRAEALPVEDLDTDAPTIFLVNAVLKSELEKSYAKQAYVGKCFLFIKHPKVSGKAYHRFTISEIAEK